MMDYLLWIGEILLVGIICFFFGFLWYGPFFGSVWAKEMKMKMPKKMPKGMGKIMFLNFIGTLISVCVMFYFISFLGFNSLIESIKLAFYLWIGFFASTTLLGGVLWEGKSWNLYLINASYWLLNLEIMAIILSMFA